MNVIVLYKYLVRRIISLYYKCLFFSIKKPLYNICYNSNGNKFQFDGYIKGGDFYVRKEQYFNRR